MEEDSSLPDACLSRYNRDGQGWLAGLRVIFLSLIVLTDRAVLNETITAKVGESCMIIPSNTRFVTHVLNFWSILNL